MITNEKREKLRGLYEAELARLKGDEGAKDYVSEILKWEAILIEFDANIDRDNLRSDELRSVIAYRETSARLLTGAVEAESRIATALERIATVMEKSGR